MIQAINLSCGYAETDILKNVELSLPSEGFTALLGPNGAGKSTLLYALMGFLKPRCGKVTLNNIDLESYKRIQLAREIAFIPQENRSEFDYNVIETVLMGRFPYLGIMQSYGNEDVTYAEEYLKQLDLWKIRHRYLTELSGGEKQRVYIARALVQNTRYIFLDESISQLDINFQIEIMSLLKNISKQQNKAIILVSHNLNLAANYADTMVFLKDGRILGSGTPNQLMHKDKLAELFGISLETTLNPNSGCYNIVYP